MSVPSEPGSVTPTIDRLFESHGDTGIFAVSLVAEAERLREVARVETDPLLRGQAETDGPEVAETAVQTLGFLQFPDPGTVDLDKAGAIYNAVATQLPYITQTQRDLLAERGMRTKEPANEARPEVKTPTIADLVRRPGGLVAVGLVAKAERLLAQGNSGFALLGNLTHDPNHDGQTLVNLGDAISAFSSSASASLSEGAAAKKDAVTRLGGAAKVDEAEARELYKSVATELSRLPAERRAEFESAASVARTTSK